MDDTWLVFIGLGKLPTNFQRHARSHHLLLLRQVMAFKLQLDAIFLFFNICMF